jgi:hypothetical protein
MRYAAQNIDGDWTGAIYEEVTPRIREHHAQFDEELHPVVGLQLSGGVWQPVLPSVQQERETWSVSRFQARQSLLNAGLLDQADDLIRASGDALIIGAWDDAQIFERLSPTIQSMAAALELTDETVDDLFRQAMQIEA